MANLMDYVSVIDFGTKGDGISDDTSAIQSAIQSVAAKGGIVFFPAGTYLVSKVLTIPSYIQLIGTGRSSQLLATADMTLSRTTTNNQGQMLEVKRAESVHIQQLFFNGGGNKAGAVVFSGATNCSIRQCIIDNAPEVQAIMLADENSVEPGNIRLLENTITRVKHGIQLWRASECLVSGNRVDQVSGGGIWQAICTDCVYSNNIISNCGDVGLDLEGGENCLAIGNHVKRCSNGELAVFRGLVGDLTTEKGLCFRGNVLDREPTYTTISGVEVACNDYGAITVHSVSDDAEDIQFLHNTIRTNGFPAIYTNDIDSTDCGVVIRGNDIRVLSDTEAFHITAKGILVDRNVFRFAVANSKANSFKNATDSILSHNQFIYESGKTTEYALHLYTDQLCNNVLIQGNEFVGCGELACKVEAYKSDKKTFIIQENSFSAKPVRNGGVLITGSYGAKYSNQSLHILLSPTSGGINLLTMPCFNANNVNNAPFITGYLDIIVNGLKKNLYNIQLYANRLVSRDSSGKPSGMLNDSTYYATFTGTTITFNPAANYTGSEVALHVICNTP